MSGGRSRSAKGLDWLAGLGLASQSSEKPPGMRLPWIIGPNHRSTDILGLRCNGNTKVKEVFRSPCFVVNKYIYIYCTYKGTIAFLYHKYKQSGQ